MSLNYFGQAWRLAFEISPIILVDGLAKDVPGGMLPIAVFTEGLSIIDGVLSGELQDASTRFMPMPGTTLIQQDVAQYSFFNQATAANAVVSKPNRIVMQMLRPASVKGGYANKIMTFMALKLALDKHNQSGGSYTVMTPSFIYTGCLLRGVIDNSGFTSQNKQVQHSWALEFEQPLLTVSQLDAVLGNLMDKFESGVKSTSLSWSSATQMLTQEFGF